MKNPTRESRTTFVSRHYHHFLFAVFMVSLYAMSFKPKVHRLQATRARGKNRALSIIKKTKEKHNFKHAIILRCSCFAPSFLFNSLLCALTKKRDRHSIEKLTFSLAAFSSRCENCSQPEHSGSGIKSKM